MVELINLLCEGPNQGGGADQPVMQGAQSGWWSWSTCYARGPIRVVELSTCYARGPIRVVELVNLLCEGPDQGGGADQPVMRGAQSGWWS